MEHKIAGTEMNNKKKHEGKSILRWILILVFLCVFLFSLYKVAGIIREYIEIEKLYNDTAEEYTSEEPQDDRLAIEVDLSGLREINQDVIGWIYIPDTNVNFPVLQGKNNKQYLFQSYKKEYLTAGSIFVDYRCNANFEDKNTVIYGHNMHNGSMFGKLKKYKDEEYRDKHPEIYILKADGVWNQYEIIACFQADVEGPVYELPILQEGGEKTFEKLSNTIKNENLYSTEADISESDKLITLSTCTQDSRDDVRVVIIAKLI